MYEKKIKEEVREDREEMTERMGTGEGREIKRKRKRGGK